jgi:prophage regulatory protein
VPRRRRPKVKRLLSRADLKAKGVPWGRTQLRIQWEAGNFPRPLKISPRKLAWIEADVDAWLSAQVEYRLSRARAR